MGGGTPNAMGTPAANRCPRPVPPPVRRRAFAFKLLLWRAPPVAKLSNNHAISFQASGRGPLIRSPTKFAGKQSLG